MDEWQEFEVEQELPDGIEVIRICAASAHDAAQYCADALDQRGTAIGIIRVMSIDSDECLVCDTVGYWR